jgi:itaconate CoA-transferase
MRPLDDITVVALEHAVAAPFCTRQLADLGARVIKIERPGTGDFARAYDGRVNGLASHFVWCNRSKESLALDVKHEDAPEILQRLLSGADVLVQNLAPDAAGRLGLSYDALKAKFPRLIVCDISGYGSDGPYKNKKAYDLLIQSEAGFLSITGTPDTPSKAGCSISDIAAGMYAFSNILAALIARGKSGQGCRIDVSLLESTVEWMSYPLYYAYDGAEPPPRTGASHATIYPYGPFAAGDGGTVMLGLQNEREWKIFCERVLEARRTRHRRALFVERTARRAPRRAERRDRRGVLDAYPPTNSCAGSTPRASPMLASTRCTTSGTIRNWPRAAAGPRSGRRRAPCGRCCRSVHRRRSSRAWTRFPMSANTAWHCCPNSGSMPLSSTN